MDTNETVNEQNMKIEPYTMCSRKEVNFRQRSNEISVFEATIETADRPPSDRQLDPTRAVKKYRRSAAGGIGKDQQYPPRNLDELYRTVEYLIDMLIHWQTSLRLTAPATSFLELVHFVEDRIRAIQVDLVTSQYASKEIQYKIVKIHVMTMYLLSDTTKYEHRHGRQALQTALSSYWNQDACPAHGVDDEILALTATMQLNEDLPRLDTHVDRTITHRTHGAGFLAVYRKHVHTGETHAFRRPFNRLQRILRVISCCNTGEWTTVLRLLHQHQECGQQGEEEEEEEEEEGQNIFGVMVACLLAPTLLRIRAKALQTYNVSFMKNERLSITEVARLLCISDPTMAVRLCERLHLPLVDDNDAVLFKSAPIHMEWTKETKRDDDYVFHGQDIRFVIDPSGKRIPDETFLATFFSIGKSNMRKISFGGL